MIDFLSFLWIIAQRNDLWLQVGIALSYLVWALSSSFTLFVIARIIGGISKGNISLATAIVTDVSTPQTRGKGMVGLIQRPLLVR